MEASGRGQANETLTGQRSPWHSPVPYLFGGLAAMLGLIAFALLILACSYWKLSGYLEGNDNNGDNGQEQDLEAGNKDEDPRKLPIFEEKVLVFLTGQINPTFVATPVSSRSTSFGNNSNCGSCECDQDKGKVEMVKQDGSGDLRTEPGTTRETLPEEDH